MKRLLALLLLAVPSCVPARAADYALTYDSATLLVTTPSSFWRSNLVDTAELTWDMTGGRATPTIAASIARDSEVTSAIAAAIATLPSLYQPLDSDLTALAALNGSGLTNLNASTAFSSGQIPIARLATGTPTGSKFVRDDGTLALPPGGGGTGDVVGPASATDSVVALYDGTTGKLLKNGTLTQAAIATDSEVAAGYQPLDSDLTALAALNGAGVTNLNASTAFSSGQVPIARLSTGTPNGSKFLRDDGVLAVPAGGGGGNASTNASQGWSADVTNTFNGRVIHNGPVTVADLAINAATYGGVWGFANGGLGVTTAEAARTVLGLVPDQDVQIFRLGLLQLAIALAGDGDMPYRNSSGIVTNVSSTSAGRALLVAANAAAQRTAMGVPNIAGDTFTGPVLVPYIPYSANWTNTGSNYLVTARGIAEKIEQLSVGGYIASVASDFQVSGSQLSVTNTVGTGRIVRETASGGSASMSGLSDVSITSTNNLHKGDFLAWSGSNWVQTLAPMGVVTDPDQWEEIWYNAPGTVTHFGFTASNINGGSTANNPAWIHGRSGYQRFSAIAANGTFYSGGTMSLNGGAFAPTNEFFGKLEVLFPNTNTVNQILGFHDGLSSTNAPTDGLYLAVTNGVMRFAASMAGTSTIGSGSYVIATNFWHAALISATNQVAVVTVWTNGVVAYQDSISSVNVPGGGAVLTDFGVCAYSTGVGATNGQQLLVLKRLGMRYRTY